MEIIGAIIKDTLDKMYLHRNLVNEDTLKKSFHGKIESGFIRYLPIGELLTFTQGLIVLMSV